MSKHNQSAQAADRKQARVFRDNRRAALARKHGFVNTYAVAE